MESGKYKDAKQYHPTGIAVGPDGSVYVADGYGQNWVHKFDKDQKYVKSFGGLGEEPGKFKTCHGIALDRRGGKNLLLVSDRENKRLQHFDLDGNFVAVIAENLRRPCCVSFFGDHVVIAELAAASRFSTAITSSSPRWGTTPMRSSERTTTSRRRIGPKASLTPPRRLLRPRRQHLRRRLECVGPHQPLSTK